MILQGDDTDGTSDGRTATIIGAFLTDQNNLPVTDQNTVPVNSVP